MATHSHRKNFITTLTIADGDLISDHEQKAFILWEDSKNRLNISDYNGMTYNLSEIIQRHNLDDLHDRFSSEEINCVIKDMPNNHAYSLDGFNGLFIKRC